MALLLAALAPGAPFLTADPALFLEDVCLAPAFEGLGCPAPPPSDSRPTASAALLAPDLPDPTPRLALDESVFQAGTEVTLSY
jgi:hypothetical protein